MAKEIVRIRDAKQRMRQNKVQLSSISHQTSTMAASASMANSMAIGDAHNFCQTHFVNTNQ